MVEFEDHQIAFVTGAVKCQPDSVGCLIGLRLLRRRFRWRRPHRDDLGVRRRVPYLSAVDHQPVAIDGYADILSQLRDMKCQYVAAQRISPTEFLSAFGERERASRNRSIEAAPPRPAH